VTFSWSEKEADGNHPARFKEVLQAEMAQSCPQMPPPALTSFLLPHFTSKVLYSKRADVLCSIDNSLLGSHTYSFVTTTGSYICKPTSLKNYASMGRYLAC